MASQAKHWQRIWDVYKRQLCNLGLYTNNLLILFEFAAVIVCQKKKFPLIKKTVAGKLPLSLNRSSPKTIGLEFSTNQGCMQNIIWFCLNLRLLSFAIGKNYSWLKKNVAGKLPFSLNRSSPKNNRPWVLYNSWLYAKYLILFEF